MRKRFISLSVSFLILAALTLPAGAASDSPTDAEAILPVDIITDPDVKEVRKVYELSPDTDPSMLPVDAFERDSIRYECTDILREVVIGSETRTVTQEETADSSKKDMETILAILPQEKEITTEDGYTGTLHLVLDSIKIEPAGYGSAAKPITATRSYPNLSSADTSHLPKTITENGRTLTLQDVQWQTDNTYNADDYEIGDRFTAICTYSGSKTVQYVTGYKTTAEYTGEVYRTGVTMIRYTVIFIGAPVPEQNPIWKRIGNSWPADVVPPLTALAIGIAGTYLIMRRKERMCYEKTVDDDHPAADAGRGDDNDSADSRI